MTEMGRHQTGQIKKLARNKYHLRVQANINGDRRTISQTFYGLKDDAVDALADMVAAANHAKDRNHTSKTVDILLDEYFLIHQTKVKPQSITLYRSVAQHIRHEFGETLIHELTSHDIEKFFSGLKYKSETIIKIWRVLKAAYVKAVAWEWVDKHPMANLKAPKILKQRKTALTPEEVKLFFEHCPEDKQAQWKFFVMTGARIGEALAARWSDIDWDKKNWHVSQGLVEVNKKHILTDTKTESSVRDIPLSDTLLALLKEHKREQNIRRLECGSHWKHFDLIFPGVYGRPQNKTQVSREVRELAGNIKDLKKKITPHVFRHTFGTLALQAGMNLKIVSEIMGHSSLSVTALYLHPDAGEKEKGMRLLENLLAA